MSEIDSLRGRIDEIDVEIVQLLKRRFEVARALGYIKRAGGLPIRDRAREKRILAKTEGISKQMSINPAVTGRIFKLILQMGARAQGVVPENESPLKETRVLVLGGTHGMGLFFGRLLATRAAQVTLVGRQAAHTAKIAEELGLRAGSIHDSKSADIVLVAVPMEATFKVSLEAARTMTKGSLLLDLSSVKTGISDRIAEGIPEWLEYISLHPLFGPAVDSVYGQNIIAVPYLIGARWRLLAGALEKEGAFVQVLDEESHDRVMSYVQAIHHFALVCMGLALGPWNGRYATNSLRDTEKRIRLLVESWNTVEGIQRMNPYASEARERFARIASRLSKVDRWSRLETLSELRANVQKWSRKQ